jgi:hypothetical protein
MGTDFGSVHFWGNVNLLVHLGSGRGNNAQRVPRYARRTLPWLDQGRVTPVHCPVAELLAAMAQAHSPSMTDKQGAADLTFKRRNLTSPFAPATRASYEPE